MSDKNKRDQISRLELENLILSKRLREALSNKTDANRLSKIEFDITKINKRLDENSKTERKADYKLRGKVVETFWCYFLVGSNRGYDTTTFISYEEIIKHVSNFQQKYWNESISVNVSTNNTIVFKDYKEMCYRVEAIQYPRFPKSEKEIIEFMLTLMEYLAVNLDQQRITLVTPNKTVMFENTRLIDELAIKKES